MLIVLTSCGSTVEANSLARLAVSQKLAACVQILPSVESVYEWKGKVVTEKECLLLFKTDRETYSLLEDFIKTEHSYEVPEIAAVDVSEVSEEYGSWLRGVLR